MQEPDDDETDPVFLVSEQNGDNHMSDEANLNGLTGAAGLSHKELLRLERVLADDEFIPELKMKNEHLLK